MNRGSSARDERSEWQGSGFNEAPIHESGKSGRLRKPTVCFFALQ